MSRTSREAKFQAEANAKLSRMRPDNLAHMRSVARDGERGKVLRSPIAQARAGAILRQFPGLRVLFATPDATPVDVIFNAARVIGDPSRSRELARAVGLPPTIDHGELVDIFAKEMGLPDGRALRTQYLEPLAKAEEVETFAVEMFAKDDDRDRVSGIDKSIPDIDERTRKQVEDQRDLRATLERQMGQAEASRHPFEKAKKALYHPSSSLQVDLARAMSAHLGEDDRVAGNSEGRRRWESETSEEEKRESNLHLDIIRSQVAAERNAEHLYESTLAETPDDAVTQAFGQPPEEG